MPNQIYDISNKPLHPSVDAFLRTKPQEMNPNSTCHWHGIERIARSLASSRPKITKKLIEFGLIKYDAEKERFLPTATAHEIGLAKICNGINPDKSYIFKVNYCVLWNSEELARLLSPSIQKAKTAFYAKSFFMNGKRGAGELLVSTMQNLRQKSGLNEGDRNCKPFVDMDGDVFLAEAYTRVSAILYLVTCIEHALAIFSRAREDDQRRGLISDLNNLAKLLQWAKRWSCRRYSQEKKLSPEELQLSKQAINSLRETVQKTKR